MIILFVDEMQSIYLEWGKMASWGIIKFHEIAQETTNCPIYPSTDFCPLSIIIVVSNADKKVWFIA